MPRRRHAPPPDPFADYPPEDRKQAAIMKRRSAYLVTNRRYLHECAVLVHSGFRYGRFDTPDLLRLAREVATWLHEADEALTGDHSDYWTIRRAIQALRPACLEKPVYVPRSFRG